jgi:hypothetical protein
MLFPAAETAPSAGGAPLQQVAIVGAFTAVMYGVVLWVVLRERAGRVTLVGRAADLVSRIEGGPRWFALPSAVSVVGALSGATGVYWDVSIHIAKGRDPGPLANPAHYFIFLGLMLIFVGGALGMALKDERMPRRTLRLTRRWSAPLGPTLGAAISMCALLGFPLDDLWHRTFGQDVTEWGPTHIIMIGGTIMLPYALLLTVAEAKQVGGSKLTWFWEYIAVLVLLIGPVAFLLEFAYGVAQFPLINDVVLITIATAVGYVYAMYKGPFQVLAVWVGYAVAQGGLVLTNVYIWHAMTPKQPVLIGGALAAAVLARWAKPTVAFVATSGVVIALANLLTEYYWTNAYRVMSWPVNMMGWAALTAAITGLVVALIATWMHLKLSVVSASAEEDAAAVRETSRGRTLGGPVSGAVAGLAFLTLVGVFVVNVPPRTEGVGNADVTVGRITNGRAYLDVVVPDSLVKDAYWFEAMSWQGGGQVRAEMRKLGPNHYRTEKPMPVTGDWKTLIRLQLPVHVEVSAPVYLPADPAVPVDAFPATNGPRDFIEEKLILQREVKPDVPMGLWSVAYFVVGLVFMALFGSVAVAYAVAGRPGCGELKPPIPHRNKELVGAGR